MTSCGVKKNYTKFQVLAEISPKHIQDEVKHLLRKQATDFPNNDAYKILKHEILRIFGCKPEVTIQRALNRVLVGKPSTLARAIANDICKRELVCPCCPAVVSTLWKRHLGSAVQAGIAHLTFSKENFDQILQLADDIHQTQPAQSAYQVSAVAASAPGPNDTLPAIPYPEPEVSAVSRGRGRGRGRGGRGRSGTNRGGQASAAPQAAPQAQATRRHRGPKHPDLPAGEWQGCALHYRWGRQAHFCSEPATCPWKNIFTPKQPRQQ